MLKSQQPGNIQSNNNLWISIEDRYIWENYEDGTMNWKTNLDYDGFDWFQDEEKERKCGEEECYHSFQALLLVVR